MLQCYLVQYYRDTIHHCNTPSNCFSTFPLPRAQSLRGRKVSPSYSKAPPFVETPIFLKIQISYIVKQKFIYKTFKD